MVPLIVLGGRMSIAVSTEFGVGGVGRGLLILAVRAGHCLRWLVV